jgi:hypothetical protein
MLIVIDAKALIYKRYIGRTPGVKVKAEQPLLPYEIEMLRTRPDLILPSEPPQLA